ncbi:MAG: S9 family peptidase [Bacteroidales bacterium]|jgi:dipeptidyl aminopeptidase/acylaminoacyl peptidase|nr:S9 family peptidase [Bacteroidales bacterium]
MKKFIFIFMISSTIFGACRSADKKAVSSEKENAVIDKDSREVPDFSRGIFSEEILWYLGRISDPRVSPDGETVLYAVKYYDYKLDKGNQELYTVPARGGSPKRITTTVENEFGAIWRPDGKKIAFLREGEDKDGIQVWECNPDGSAPQQLSRVKTGVSAFYYAPDLAHVLYLTDVPLDSTVQTRYPDLPKAHALIADELMYRHWDHWADGSYTHAIVATYPDFENPVDLTPDCPYIVDEVTWHPNGKQIAYSSKKLTGKAFSESTNADIYLYDIENGNTLNLTEVNEGYDREPCFSPDGKYMAYWSMKTPGYESDKQRLMVLDLHTGNAIDYSTHFDQNAEHFVWAADSRQLYFLSGIQATIQAYRLDIVSGEISQLSRGDHDYNTLDRIGEQLLVTKTTMATPTELYTLNPTTGQETQLTFENKDILEKITSCTITKRWVRTTDNKDMLVWVILPPNFDSTKCYPALLYCQGGPQQTVSQFFSYRWNFQMMAAHDYIIVAPNRRGLPGFGSEWNDQISLDYGGQNMKDYLSAIDAVAKEPYVDKNRLGAVGASYGGFSIYWLAGHHQKRFKAFIAHCGMFNFESWYATTDELFFANHDLGGPYWQKNIPHSYTFSPHRFVGNWDTPILVIHGGNDFRIPYTEGMQAFHAARIQNIPARFLFFPEEWHFVSSPQNAILWQREFFRWLDTYLK